MDGSLNESDRLELNKLMNDSVYNQKDYIAGFAKIQTNLPLIEKIINQLLTVNWPWNFRILSQYIIRLTLYGPGGSYNPDMGEITLLTTPDGNFKGYNSPSNTIIHEIIHIGIESSIIQNYNLSHSIKERIVDRFVQAFFNSDLPDYRIQNLGDDSALIDRYLQSKRDFENLPNRIEQYLSDNQ